MFFVDVLCCRSIDGAGAKSPHHVVAKTADNFDPALVCLGKGGQTMRFCQARDGAEDKGKTRNLCGGIITVGVRVDHGFLS